MMPEAKLIEHRLGELESDVSEVKSAIKSIADTLRTLTALEAHHAETRDALARAFTEIESSNLRLRAIENEMPVLLLMSGKIRNVERLIMSAFVLALVGLVVIKT